MYLFLISVFVACEKLLWYDGLYPHSLLLISSVFAVYALLRLVYFYIGFPTHALNPHSTFTFYNILR